jgi:hypothetical protein
MRAALHFTGHRFIDNDKAVADAIAAELGPLDIVAACGSLASGADILFAEYLARIHVKLCLWLPFDLPRFVATSVRPAGAAWVARFETALSRAATVSILDGGSAGDPYAACSSAAMDAAQAWAAAEAAAPVQVALWNGVASTGAAGTGADVAAWRARGLESRIIPIIS